MRLLSSFFALFLLGTPILVDNATAQPLPPEPLRVRQSEPKTVNDATFIVVAEADWKLGQNALVEIQLRITNLKKIDLLFPTFDAFGLKVANNDGKEIMPTGGRNYTAVTRPILIAPGASYTICRRAELQRNATTAEWELAYWDGTGAEMRFGPINPGRYKISFFYGCPPEYAKHLTKTGNAVTWVGNTLTHEAIVDAVGK
jgi:hypothetical protein